ncbi:MAG: hypothetical protein RIF41_08685, partial [Polyangiaceae bacterium]
SIPCYEMSVPDRPRFPPGASATLLLGCDPSLNPRKNFSSTCTTVQNRATYPPARSTPGALSTMTTPRTTCLVSLLGISSCLLGCGHPATQQECEEIFQRSAEIELRAQNVTDPDLVDAKIAEAKAVRGRELLDECVGKRITQDAMACVRQAETAEALDACLQ